MSPEAGTPADGDEPTEDRPPKRSRLNQTWSQETEAQLWQAVRLYGCRWGRIAQLRPFTSRSVQSLRCHHERIVLRMVNEPWYEARLRRLARTAGVVAGTDELHARCHASPAFTESWATRDMDVIQARSCRTASGKPATEIQWIQLAGDATAEHRHMDKGRPWDYVVKVAATSGSSSLTAERVPTERHALLIAAWKLSEAREGSTLLVCNFRRAENLVKAAYKRKWPHTPKESLAECITKWHLSVKERDALNIVHYESARLQTMTASWSGRSWVGGSAGGFYLSAGLEAKMMGVYAKSGGLKVAQSTLPPSTIRKAIGQSMNSTWAEALMREVDQRVIGGLGDTYASLWSGHLDAGYDAMANVRRNTGRGEILEHVSASDTDPVARAILRRTKWPSVRCTPQPKLRHWWHPTLLTLSLAPHAWTFQQPVTQPIGSRRSRSHTTPLGKHPKRFKSTCHSSTQPASPANKLAA